MISLQKRILATFILSTTLIFSCGEGKKDAENIGVGSPADSLLILSKQYPDSIQLQISLQESIYNNGDTLLALKNLQELIKKFPNNQELNNAVSVIQLQKGDTASAIASLLQSLSLNQNQPTIEFELAFLEAARKNKSALEIADHIIARYSERDIQANGHFAKAIYYANISQPKQAIQELDSAIIKNFTLIDAYIEKGILQLENKEASNAIATLSKAVALDKNNADILFWIGKAYQQKKEFDQALLYFRETLKIEPNYTAAQNAIKDLKNN
jgi:tetratricopeptide (TPR) repeat protein